MALLEIGVEAPGQHLPDEFADNKTAVATELLPPLTEAVSTESQPCPETVIDLANLALLAAENAEPTITETGPADRGREIFRLSRNPTTFEVAVESDITLEDYEKITAPKHFELLHKLAEPLHGKTVVFINPTMEGGGVAMMRPPLVHLLRQLGVDAHWYVMDGKENEADPNPFEPTKKIHNIIQRRLPADARLTEAEQVIHQCWAAGRNAEVLTAQETIQTADIIVIDDPQPTPLIPHLKVANPESKIIWRNHIDNDGQKMSDPTTPQGEVWRYLRDECGVGLADAYIFHPSADHKFVPPDIFDKTYIAPATTEPHDDMNRPLSSQEIEAGIEFINDEIARKNRELAAEDRIEAIDPSRDCIAMVARFDESKGGDKWMALGVRTKQMVKEKLLARGLPADIKRPQVVFLGNGSVDDPSGKPEFEKMLRLRRERYPEDKQDIILGRIKHNYTAINAFMHRRMDASLVAVQMSDAEGCETRISDWTEHGVPVVVSSRGGMSLQVKEGESGIILDYDKPDLDIEHGADFISELIVNPDFYELMSKATKQVSETYNQREYTTTANATRWLRAFRGVLAGQKPDKLWKISDMIGAELAA